MKFIFSILLFLITGFSYETIAQTREQIHAKFYIEEFNRWAKGSILSEQSRALSICSDDYESKLGFFQDMYRVGDIKRERIWEDYISQFFIGGVHNERKQGFRLFRNMTEPEREYTIREIDAILAGNSREPLSAIRKKFDRCNVAIEQQKEIIRYIKTEAEEGYGNSLIAMLLLVPTEAVSEVASKLLKAAAIAKKLGKLVMSAKGGKCLKGLMEVDGILGKYKEAKEVSYAEGFYQKVYKAKGFLIENLPGKGSMDAFVEFVNSYRHIHLMETKAYADAMENLAYALVKREKYYALMFDASIDEEFLKGLKDCLNKPEIEETTADVFRELTADYIQVRTFSEQALNSVLQVKYSYGYGSTNLMRQQAVSKFNSKVKSLNAATSSYKKTLNRLLKFDVSNRSVMDLVESYSLGLLNLTDVMAHTVILDGCSEKEEKVKVCDCKEDEKLVEAVYVLVEGEKKLSKPCECIGMLDMGLEEDLGFIQTGPGTFEDKNGTRILHYGTDEEILLQDEALRKQMGMAADKAIIKEDQALINKYEAEKNQQNDYSSQNQLSTILGDNSAKIKEVNNSEKERKRIEEEKKLQKLKGERGPAGWAEDGSFSMEVDDSGKKMSLEEEQKLANKCKIDPAYLKYSAKINEGRGCQPCANCAALAIAMCAYDGTGEKTYLTAAQQNKAIIFGYNANPCPELTQRVPGGR